MDSRRLLVSCVLLLAGLPVQVRAQPPEFFAKHCHDCHQSGTQSGGLDFAELGWDLAQPETFAQWVKIYDKVAAGEMPPPDQPRPPADSVTAALRTLQQALVQAEQDRFRNEPRTGIRRLTRAEYEHTIRDLFDMPGIALQGDLPADGSAHGFDKNSDALEISHVNLAKYLDAADLTLDLAIATRPTAPTVQRRRISLANSGGFVAHVLLNGEVGVAGEAL